MIRKGGKRVDLSCLPTENMLEIQGEENSIIEESTTPEAKCVCALTPTTI